jgi:prolyl oligopeptidase
VVDVVHGVHVHDPYRWLENGDSADVRNWVTAQNDATRRLLDARPDRELWATRLTSSMARPVALGAQVRDDTVVLLERPEAAPQARLVARTVDTVDTLDSVDSVEPVVIADPATAAADAAVAVDWFHLSPDGTLVAYGVSEGGTENSVLRVARTSDGTHLEVEIPNTRACSIGWEPDGSGFCYTRYPEGDEYHRTVHRHHFGDDWRHDPVVWAEHPTPQTWPEVEVSPDGRHVLVSAMRSWSHVEVHLLDRRSGEWTDVVTGVEATSSFTFGHDDQLIGTTTIDAPNGRVVTVALADADVGPDGWTTIVPEREVVVGGLAVAGEALLLVVTRRATDSLERWPLGGRADEPTETFDLGVVSIDALSADADTGRAVAVVSGFTRPGELVRLDETDVSSSPSSSPSLSPAVAPDELVVSEVEYPSIDGTAIGMFVVHRADVDPLDPATTPPTILTGYGGFAIAMSPAWSPTIAAWCGAGGVYAVAGLRGGLEHGEAWHRAGKREHKQTVFDDFAAAADWLVSTGRTTRDHLAIAGGSNGGLLVGATVTQRPDLCRAAWCAVPLLDMVRFPRFLIARLWTEEYGDPDVAEEFAWLHAYSPYHRVVDGTCYPAVLLTTAEGDTRVDPLHARKMAARLQAATSCASERPVLLHQEGRAGHGQGKPVAKRVAEQADVLAFLTWQLGAPLLDADADDDADHAARRGHR